ncbi:MAG: V/A-type H+/Na+-transporting ATPase subunit [Sphaerochaeta sp.]|jgi:V/A-type H+-transporting ATPase subunit C|uniref:ATPase n=1 Tax=Sphaerochaeta halotolerans TaxID=2293840 RepID=A0A372MHE8_9SPIR|nr:V-type ATPase subunit [Sphaerochaeta halotolerans]MBG0767410.1 V-type ATPase subunit [Spirochaetaceae bacterium]MDK2859648.1 V/A-type H+/Na+-transporting ATPase subunit [Sphaerochaeta sp.]MDN5334050.1 V/A-type H+/Na+-transporting ATPase subunit [Sphaerochaeta sp.]RFU94873.1 ATPase [Sphaerochaeta halotolerans]
MSSDRVSLYGFINAKLRAKIGLMRQSKVIENLLHASSLVEAVGVLRDSKYHAVAEAYDRTGDLQQMELVLLGMEISMYKEVARYLEGSSADLINHLLEKIEIDNLKNTLRLWYSSIMRQRPIRHRSEYLFKEIILYPIDWTALINATSWDVVGESLKDSPYHATVTAFSEQDLQQSGLFPLETALDRMWYVHLMDCVKTLKKADEEVATSMFLLEIDLRNLIMLVRYGWYHHMDADAVKKLLLPWGKVASSKETEAYLRQNASERNPHSIINRYYPGLEQETVPLHRESTNYDEASLLETLKIEGYLAERRKAIYQRMLAQDPFTIGLSLSYFFLFKEETSMVKAILNGKYYGYEEAYIRGVLV